MRAALQRGSAPAAARHRSALIALLGAFGFDRVGVLSTASEHASVLATFAASETFRWYGRGNQRHPRPTDARQLENPGRLCLSSTTSLSPSRRRLSVLALVLAYATVALIFKEGFPSSGWLFWAIFFLFAWFMGLVLRRQVVLAAELRLLRDKAEQVAVLQERQRLSRELHDSVTQALYGIALYAEAGGRALAAGETGLAETNLREIGETTQEALGEMRLLLYELRPPVGTLRAHARGVRRSRGRSNHAEHSPCRCTAVAAVLP